MANQKKDDFLSVRSTMLDKYNVPNNSSGGSSKGKSSGSDPANDAFMTVRQTMLTKYSDENAKKNRDSVYDWSKRFESVMSGFSQYENQRNGGYTRDASGGYASEIDALMRDYGTISGYAGRYGLPNAQRYYKQLQQIKQYIGDTNTVMSQFEDEDAYNRYLTGQRGDNTPSASGNSAAPAASVPTGGQQRRTREQVGADITSVDNEISELQEQIRGLRQKQAGYGRSFTISKSEKERVKAEIEEAEAQLAELKQRKSALGAESDSFVADEYRAKIAALPEKDRKALEDFHGNYQAMAYGYLLRQGYDRKEIDAMWETMQRDKNAELSESAINGTYDWTGQNAGTAVAGFGGARVGNLAGAVTGTFQVINDLARHYLRGSPYSTTDPNSLGYLPSRMAGAADQAVSDAIEGEEGGIVRKGAAFVYRGAANAADNLVRMAVSTAIGGPAAGAAVNSAFSFTQGFQGSYREAVERGGSPVQALLMGSIDGGMEVFTESNTFERWMNLKDPELISQGVYEWLKTAAIGIGNEITEEEASYIANTIADAVVMANKGENAEYIRKAVANGLTPNEAKWELAKKIAHEMAMTAAETAMSTLIMDGVTGAVENRRYKKTYGQYADDLVEAWLESPEGSKSREIAERMKAKMDAGKAVSGADIRNIMMANDQLNQEEAREEALREDGFSIQEDDSGNTAEIEFAEKPSAETQQALKDAGFKWSKRDKVWYGKASQEQARQIVQEAMGQRTDSGMESKTGENDSVKKDTAENAHDRIINARNDAAQAEKQTETSEESKPFTISPTKGKTLLNREDGSTVETNIIDIASNDGGKLMLNVMGQKEPVSADKIAYANAGDAALYHAISGMEITPAQAKEFVSLAKTRGNQDGQFAFGIQQMYTLGESGVPLSRAVNSSYGGRLSADMKEFGYYLGRQVYDRKIAQAEAQKSASASAQKARAAMSGTKVNGVQYDGLNVRTGEDGSVEIDGVTLNEQQKAGIQAAEMLASMGLNVHVFQSQTDANGKPIGENGSYSMKDGSIHIDLNAGSSGQGVMAYTIAHEFTHFMEQQSPKMFQSFTDALFEALDTDVEAEIADKAAKLRRQRPDVYRNASKQKLMDDARSEVVAEACETMLTDTDAAERIGQSILNRNKGLFEKIVNWFKGIAEKLRKAYEGMNPDSAIARNAKKTIQQVDGLVQMWADMAVDAAENYRTAEAVSNSVLSDDTMLSITRTKAMSWGQQIRSLLNGNGKVKHMDTLVAMNNTPQYLKHDGVQDLPLAIPISVITKAQKGKNDSHKVSDQNLIALRYGLENSIAVIDNPGRNSLAFITPLTEMVGEETANVCAFFDKNAVFDNDKVHRATSIHSRTDISAMLDKLSDDAVIYVKNKNEFESLVGMADSIPAAYKSKIKFVSDNVAQDDGTVKHSDRDSEGKELTEGQLAYFQNSKIRDADGNLMVMYRGGHDEFTVFDRKKSSPFNLYGRGFYFTNSEAHAKTYGNAKPFYLNITHPLMQGQKTITRQQMRKFIQAVADNEDDYGLDNYGYGATVASVLKDVWGKGDYEMIWDLNQTAIGDMVAAVELFNEVNGTDYDGLVMPTETVTFQSNQAKNIDNENPTADPDIRFSMRDSIEETKDLVAVHNLSEESLMKSLELGGLPMPSIAIIKAQSGHSKFGDISLVFRKESIDPKANSSNRIYGGDAWTPMFPRVDYKASEAVESRLYEKYYDLIKQYGSDEIRPLYKYQNELAQQLANHGGEKGLMDALKDDVGMMQVFLYDTGKGKVEPVVTEKTASMDESEIAENEFILRELGEETIREMKAPPGVSPMQHRKQYMAKYGDQIKAAFLKFASEVYGFTEQEAENVLAFRGNNALVNLVRNARKYMTNGAVTVTQTVDTAATNDKIREAAKDGYEQWLKDTFTGAEEKKGIRNKAEPYTPSGKRRSFEALHYEFNLENIVKAMKADDEKGGSVLGSRNIFGAAATDFSSADAVKGASDRLTRLTTEEYAEIRNGFYERFDEIISGIPKSSNPFARDDAANMLIEAITKFKTRSAMDSYLRKESQGWANYSSYILDDLLELVSDIRKMPTEYFEAKPQRAVGFDEVAVAIIPSDASAKLKTALADIGVKTVEYSGGDENARIAALNGLDDVRFSYREDDDIARQNIRLMDDITDLQRLLEIRKDILSKGVANGKEVRSVASKLLDSSNRTMDADSRKNLEEMIQETFGLFARPDSTSDEVAMKIMENLHNIAEYVIDEGEVSTPADPRAQEVLEEIKGQRFRLSDSQKAEVNHAFGSVAAFRKMIAGTVILDNNANQTLDELWANHLSSVGQEYFRPDTNEGDQPSALVSAIGNLKGARQMDEGWGQISPDEFMWDVMNAVYGIRPMTEGDWNAQARKILDRHEKRVAEMQNAYEARMRDQNETISEGQRYYTRKVNDLEGKIGELQAELDRAAKAGAADLSIMEREFNRLARAYESTSRKKENSIDALRERLKKEARSHREDNAQWEKEFNRLLKEYQASGESLQKMAQQRQSKLESQIAELKAEKDRLKTAWDEEAAAMTQSHKYDLQEQERAHKQRLKDVREEMRLDAEAELDRVVGNFKDKRKAAVENRHRTEYRQQIHKMADKFHKMATAPAKANTAHAPVGLVSAVAKFCEIFAESEERAIEFAANALDSRESDMQMMNDLRGRTKTRAKEADVINRQRDRLLKKQQTITAMKQQYAEIQKDPVFAMFYDEHVNGLLKEMSEQLESTDIYEMDTEQLKQVYKTMRALMHTITNANRVFSMEKDKTLIGVTRKLGAEIDANKVSHGALAIAARRYGMWQMTPDTFFNFICGYGRDNEGKAVQKMFENGSDRMLSVQRDFYQMFRHLTESPDRKTAKHIRQMMQNPMKEMIDWGLKDASGKAVKTPRDMMLQAYMLLNQQDSFESLVYGGFKIPNFKAYYDGHVDNAYGDAEESTLLSAAIGESYMDLVHEIRERQKAIDDGGLEVQAVQQMQEEIGELRSRALEMVEGAKAKAIELRDAIEKQLTGADLDAIETAKKWYKYTGQLMTDVYLQMYGYKPNLVEGYVPIHRDLTTVKTDIREGEESKAFNLENSGFTKDRVKSIAPILLTGFFQELGNQQQKISRYYGFAIVQKDFNRIWNLRMPGARTTINSKVVAKFGTGKSWLGVSGERYVQNYIQSVAGVSANDDILGKFYGNSASATLSANPRVAVSQLASIPTAAAVVGWKSMAAGFAKGISISLSTKKKNRLANDSVWFFQRYRGAGGITEISDLKAAGGMWSRVASSNVGKALFNWCQAMDVFATASMWSMAEDYVQSNGMEMTDDGYKLAVEQCYADIIRKSQPNYTVTERSDMLRDKRAGMKLLTMYKTQSNQNLNILMNSIGEYRAAVKAEAKNHSAENKAYLKNAQKNLANGITSVSLGGTLAFVMLRTLVNFIMGNVKPYKDEETGELSVKAIGEAVLKEALSSAFGMFALGGQLFDIVSSVVTGGKYYGISDTAIESLTAMAESAVTLMQRVGDEDKDVEWRHVEKLLSSTLATCGVPYKNMKSFLGAAEMWYNTLTSGSLLEQYNSGATTKQYRARILEGWRNGDMDKVNDCIAIFAAGSDKDTDAEIAKDVAHGFANNYLKGKVTQGEITQKEAIRLLEYIGHDNAENTVNKWVFTKNNPDSKMTDSGVAFWYQNQDISVSTVESVFVFYNSATADKDADGKSISGSKKQKAVDYIAGLSISEDQKRRLFTGLNAGSLKGTPWE